MPTAQDKPRQRVPASERRDALVSAAIHHFAHGGLHGTPVDKIAREVGVAQPYVFSLFGSKRDLFIAAVERCYRDFMKRFTPFFHLLFFCFAITPLSHLPSTDKNTENLSDKNGSTSAAHEARPSSPHFSPGIVARARRLR